MQKKTKRKVLIVSCFAAAGVGAYFGFKKGLGTAALVEPEVLKTLKQIETNTSSANLHLGQVISYFHHVEGRQNSQRMEIDTAILKDIPFQHFPGLGVRFNSNADTEKVTKLIEKNMRKAA